MGETDGELARFAREASRAVGVPRTAEQIVSFAQQELGSSHAGITLLQPTGGFTSIGVTDPVVAQADEMQYELHEGPCVDVAEHAHIQLSPDIGRDTRWPVWGPSAHALGLTSVLSAQLRARGRRIGGLNLYGDQPRQFSAEDAALAHLFAVHAAVALASALTEQQLRTALDTRTEIAQAQGILMERFGIGADQAFAVLRRYSQATNAKLHLVAEALIEQRELPPTGHDT